MYHLFLFFLVVVEAQNHVVQPEELLTKKTVHHQHLTAVVEDVLHLDLHHLLHRLLNVVQHHLHLEGK